MNFLSSALKASGTVGGGFRFDMRAGGGLNGNEQPVVYIDGMRVVNDEIGGTGSNALTTGGQGISTLLDFNPDDIENIEILKGDYEIGKKVAEKYLKNN